jgi:hypothetical protein
MVNGELSMGNQPKNSLLTTHHSLSPLPIHHCLFTKIVRRSSCFGGLFLYWKKYILMAKLTKVAAKPVKKAAKKAAVKKTVVKKAAVTKLAAKTTKPAKKEKTISIKYADKSAGQPELVKIFDAIKKMMLPYDKKGSLVLHAATGGQVHLVSHKSVEIEGRKRQEMWLVSALVQKGYVGFHYLPVYMNKSMEALFSPGFIKCLKGKACFHIKKNDPVILAEVQKAIRIGYEAYQKRGWV